MPDPTIAQETSPLVQAVDLAKEAANLPPALYFNGFTVIFSGSDFSFILKTDNKPVQFLKSSFTVAKTLGLELTKAIERFEATTEHQIMTIKEVDEKLRKSLNNPS